MWANPPGRTEFSTQVGTCPVGVCCHEYELAVRKAASGAHMDGVFLFHPEAPHHLGALKTRLEKALTWRLKSNPFVGAKGLSDASSGLALKRGKHVVCWQVSGFPQENPRLNEPQDLCSTLWSTALKEKGIWSSSLPCLVCKSSGVPVFECFLLLVG